MSAPAQLRRAAEGLAAPLPPLLAAAERLAQAVHPGIHGRRRAGQGDEFWQYRVARPGESARWIDWRRSARSDQHFIREKEWQAAQSVHLWIDEAQSMRFPPAARRGSKQDRASLLALALAVLLIRGGERVALAALGTLPRPGKLQLLRIAGRLASAPDPEAPDYGIPNIATLQSHAKAVFVSDFLGDVDAVKASVAEAANRGVRGLMLQVLDPQEEAFPYDGRTVFQSIGQTLRHETMKASGLRTRYQDRLARRKAALSALAGTTGWLYAHHLTSDNAAAALLWLYRGIERRGF